MSPVTHFLTGWVAASFSPKLGRRERAVVTLASVLPDMDGAGIIPELVTRGSEHPLFWYSAYHHILCHNLAFGLILALAGWAATRRFLIGALVLLSFHLHIAEDLVGSRSPDGYQWPVIYLYPISHSLELTWNGQWQLNSWPNYAITLVALLIVFLMARKRGYSPLELISTNADRTFVEVLRRRWPLGLDHDCT